MKTGIGQSKYRNLHLFHVVWSVPAKVFLTVTFSIWSILTDHDLFGSDVEQDWSYTVFAVIFFTLITLRRNWPIRSITRVLYHQLKRYNSLWLWRWLPRRLSKRQSLSTTTVLFRTTFTRTIKLNLLLKWLLGSNLSHFYNIVHHYFYCFRLG